MLPFMSPVPASRRFCSALLLSTRTFSLGGALFAAAFSWLSVAPRTQAQSPGTQDTSFALEISNATVFAVATQKEDLLATDRVLIAGDKRILERSLSDGTNDVTFGTNVNFGGTNRIVYTVALETITPGAPLTLSNQKIYIGGLFGRFDANSVAQNIMRLNPDGSSDTTFNPGKGVNGYVTAIIPLPQSPDGTRNGALIGGTFTQYDTRDHNHLVKLNEDGTVDGNFNANLQTDGEVFSLAQQIDGATGLLNGQFLVAGRYNRINDNNQRKLARIDGAGNLDTTFNPTFSKRVLTVVSQPDGKIIAGGSFTTVNGLSVNNLVRLNQDGTTDLTFSANVTGNVNPVDAPPTAVNVVLLAPDGRIYVGGNFLQVNGVNRRNLARLNADGSLDTSFDPGDLLQNRVQTLSLQSDNNLIVGETRLSSPDGGKTFPSVLFRLFGGPLLPPPVIALPPAPLPPATVSVITTRSPARNGSSTAGVSRQNGRIQITRVTPFSLDSAQQVFFRLGGSAVLGTDYNLTNSALVTDSVHPTGTRVATIPAGADRVTLKVKPMGPGNTTGPTTKVILTLDGDVSYNVGQPGSARVKILSP